MNAEIKINDDNKINETMNDCKNIKKEKKPKVECCACNEMFRENKETTIDEYGDIYCFDCYDDEYVKCCGCDEEILREKADEEYWERDGDCYCESCRDEYDCDDRDNFDTWFCWDGCGRILHRQKTNEWFPRKVKADLMYAMALVCKECNKKNPKNRR